MTLFLASVFTAMAPEYKLYAGSYLKVTFLYILAFYGILFFTEHITMDQMRAKGVHVKAQNNNETHYAAVVLGLGVGLLFRGRARRLLMK